MRRRLMVALLVFAGCGGPIDQTIDPAIDLEAAGLVEEGSPEAFSILTFLNGPDATSSYLDNEVGLDRRAANNIATHVRGPDGRLGTRDDNPIDTIAELDLIKYVGKTVFGRLLAFVDGMQSGARTIEGVELTGAQVGAILRLVNQATTAQLDGEVGLDRRAAERIVAGRPFFTIETLAAVPYVGARALQALLTHVSSREQRDLPYAEVEGVVLTEREVTAILVLVNRATRDQLDTEAGLDSRAATNLVGARPIRNVGALAAVSYVGARAIKQLRDYAPTWTPPSSGSSGCQVELRAQPNSMASAYSRLLAAAGRQTPIGRVVAYRATGCTDIATSADARRVVATTVASEVFAMGGRVVGLSIGPYSSGGRKFGFALRSTRLEVETRVATGEWDPAADGRDGPLYPRMREMLENLRRDVEQNPGAYMELRLGLDERRCDDSATVLFDTRDGALLVVHRTPC